MSTNDEEEEHHRQHRRRQQTTDPCDIASRVFDTNAEFVDWLKHGIEHAVSNEDYSLLKKLLRVRQLTNFLVAGSGDEDTLLHLAATRGRRGRTVRMLLHHGASVDVPNGRGHTPLHLAATCDNIGATRALLAGGASARYRNENTGRSALDLAAYAGHLGVMAVLFKYRAMHVVNDGDTALHRATVANNPDAIDMIICRGRADYNSKNMYGKTPLHVATDRDYADAVARLIQLGVDIDMVDSEGQTPLHLTVSSVEGCPAAAQELLNAGANVNSLSRRDEFAPLDFATYNGHVKMVEALIQQGATVSATDSKGRSALHHAADRNEVGVIHALLDAGAPINDLNVDGHSPLHRCCEGTSTEAVRCLLANGAKVDVLGNKMQSPLHVATRSSTMDSASEIVDLLLRADADETAVDIDGLTPVQAVGLDVLVAAASDAPRHNVRVLELLVNAATDKAWRRRGFLTMCRALPDKAPVRRDIDIGGSSSSSSEHTGDEMTMGRHRRRRRRRKRARVETSNQGKVGAGADSGGSEGGNLVAKLVRMREDDIFRNIVHFL